MCAILNISTLCALEIVWGIVIFVNMAVISWQMLDPTQSLRKLAPVGKQACYSGH